MPCDVTLYNFTRANYCELPNAKLYVYSTLSYTTLSECMPSYFTQSCATVYLIVHFITWWKTVPFHLKLIHFTSHWTVSLDSAISCSAILCYPFSFVIMLCHFMYRYPIWHFSSPVIHVIITHLIFLLACDWSKHVTWLNIPQLKLGNIREYTPSFKMFRCATWIVIGSYSFFDVATSFFVTPFFNKFI